MDISQELRDYLVDECRFVAARLRAIEGNELAEAAYYYSAVFGGLNRVLNISYSDDLCLAHMVTFSAHQALSQRISAFLAGQEPMIKIPTLALQWLADATDALGSDLSTQTISLETLALTARVGHMLTGNGYYLAVRGRIGPDDGTR